MDGKDGGEGGAINQSEEIRSRGSKTERVETESPNRVKIERQKQKRVETESPNRVKIKRQKQKRVENRLSKHEANPKPIVKVRKQVKTEI